MQRTFLALALTLSLRQLDLGVEGLWRTCHDDVLQRLGPARGDALGRTQLGNSLANPVSRRYTEHIRASLVHVHETSAGVEARDEVGRVLRQRAELLAESAEHGRQGPLTHQLVAGAALLRDISEDHHPNRRRGPVYYRGRQDCRRDVWHWHDLDAVDCLRPLHIHLLRLAGGR